MSLEALENQNPNCPCDAFVHPTPTNIPAGLKELPRQVATFPEFRRAMLAEIHHYAPLANWQARKEDDLGLMLIEMWAYICDSISFYDDVIAHEAYLRTSRMRPSVRKLLGLLGYLPRPAIAGTVKLAALADGRKPVSISKGTAFRSGSFGEEPPQIFELEKDTAIHPFANQWNLQRTPLLLTSHAYPSHFLVRPTSVLDEGRLLLVLNEGKPYQSNVLRVNELKPISGTDGQNYTRLELDRSSWLQKGSAIAKVGLFTPGMSARVRALGKKSSGESNWMQLDRVYPDVLAGQHAIVTFGAFLHWGVIESVEESTPEDSFAPVTTIYLSKEGDGGILNFSLAWNSPEVSTIRVHIGLRRAGIIVQEPQQALSSDDPLLLTKPVEEPLAPFEPHDFLLEDKNNRGIALRGELSDNHLELEIPDRSTWIDPLYSDVKVYANVLHASRGESVLNETLGSGDASSKNQSFLLKKDPLTYFLSPTAENDQGVVNSLEVFVDGIKWTEIPNFFKAGEDDSVYIVRQTDEGKSMVTFGDGVRGRRLPSGFQNVIAHYRFGAGAASPPAGSINQMSKPAAGLQAILNPVAAEAGADAESAKDMRRHGPGSALLLGRVVSMKDMEVVALAIPGVVVAQAEWKWSKDGQRPTAHIWYIGGTSLKQKIVQRMANLTDPNTAFTVVPATARSIQLKLEVEIDPKYNRAQLQAALEDKLLDAESGFLVAKNIGIGQHFYRSRLYAAVLAVPGATALRSVFWNELPGSPTPFNSFAKKQYSGYFFDFETYPLTIELKGTSS